MEEHVVHTFFNEVTRSKYIYEYDISRTHSFSTVKASIANLCTVQSAELSLEGQNFIILSACWSKPHYFVINTKNCNIMWTEGTANTSIKFKTKYSTIISLSTWIKTLQKLGKNQILIEWTKSSKFIGHKEAIKKYRPK